MLLWFAIFWTVSYRRVTNVRISAHFSHLRKFRNFVFATEVTIFSDHNPLVYLRECAPKSAKLTRWALGLQEFMNADSNMFHTSVNLKWTVLNCVAYVLIWFMCTSDCLAWLIWTLMTYFALSSCSIQLVVITTDCFYVIRVWIFVNTFSVKELSQLGITWNATLLILAVLNASKCLYYHVTWVNMCTFSLALSRHFQNCFNFLFYFVFVLWCL